jgi:hypothetical protein
MSSPKITYQCASAYAQGKENAIYFMAGCYKRRTRIKLVRRLHQAQATTEQATLILRAWQEGFRAQWRAGL